MEASPGPRELVALLAEPDRLRGPGRGRARRRDPARGGRTGRPGAPGGGPGPEPAGGRRAARRRIGKGYRVRTEALQAAAIPPAPAAAKPRPTSRRTRCCAASSTTAACWPCRRRGKRLVVPTTWPGCSSPGGATRSRWWNSRFRPLPPRLRHAPSATWSTTGSSPGGRAGACRVEVGQGLPRTGGRPPGGAYFFLEPFAGLAERGRQGVTQRPGRLLGLRADLRSRTASLRALNACSSASRSFSRASSTLRRSSGATPHALGEAAGRSAASPGGRGP